MLGGVLSPMDGIGPDDLNIARLVERVPREGVREVILALGATVDGQTHGPLCDRPAARARRDGDAPRPGRAVGGELDYLDEGTLSAAIRARTPA